MREYGQIQCAFWQSDDALKTSDAGKLLATYLLTGPHSNGIGCYRCPDGYVMADLGWDSERVSKGFEELSRNGFAYRFEGVVCMPKFLLWNKIANGNVAMARMAEFVALPKGQAKALAARALLTFCRFLSPDDRGQLETVAQTVSKGYAKQNPTQPRENQEPIQKDQSSLRSDSPSANAEGQAGEATGKPALQLTPPSAAPADLTERKAERLRQVTEDAIAAFNAKLGKPNGLLSAVHATVGREKRQAQVKRCLRTARQICEQQFGATTITPAFWEAYFAECDRDPFKSGRQQPGRGHENWSPSFEYLTREDVMLAVFDKATSEAAA